MTTGDAYKTAGVDIDAGNLAVEQMKPAIRATFNANVLADVGSFGGLYALADLPDRPVLVASTDGVGTKVKLAAELGRWRSIGHDIVNHCVNDILVQNARPLFFLDYVASSKLAPALAVEVVLGIAEACRAAGCALLGGETAEMPGVYAEGAIDLVGTVVGLVGRANLLPRQEAMQPGHALVGLPSSGPHTNGYSLIRRSIEGRDLTQQLSDGQTLADALMAPHRLYVAEIDRLQAAHVPLYGLAHLTGGGFIENIPRILPAGLAAQIDTQAWEVPPVFRAVLGWSQIGQREAFRVFNMGIGMVMVLPAASLSAVLELIPEAVPLGQMVERQPGAPGVILNI